ncbi:MAG: toll/interleukin-1 receptor domain-containing protein, partial [Proteobacteria bacterium]|nr:toll/interleukin-1 receptor domain-containing protein [Pseudomonadota bacterium]
MLFLSYSRRIAPVALSLKAELEKRGYTVFLDLTGLDGGLWSDQLKVAIERSTDFLIIVSEDTAASEAMRGEAQIALASKLSIVPLVVPSYEAVASAPSWLAEMLRYQATRLDPLDPSITVDRAVRLFKGRPNILSRLNKRFLVSLVLALSVAFVASVFLIPTPQRPLKPNTGSSSKAPSDGLNPSESAVAR